MQPILTHMNRTWVVGIDVRTNNQGEMDAGTAKIPGLWNRFYQEQIAENVPNRIPYAPTYGVYSAYASDVNGDYSVLAGASVSILADDLKGLSKVEVQEGDYLVFERKGEMPQVVMDAWKDVWNYFSNTSNYARKYTTDFELYKSADEVAIHIAVMKK